MQYEIQKMIPARHDQDLNMPGFVDDRPRPIIRRQRVIDTKHNLRRTARLRTRFRRTQSRRPDSVAPPATVFIFTDGRVEDADKVTLQKFDVDNIHVTSVGKRADNVGIIAMSARRNYETPEILEVSTTIPQWRDRVLRSRHCGIVF